MYSIAAAGAVVPHGIHCPRHYTYQVKSLAKLVLRDARELQTRFGSYAVATGAGMVSVLLFPIIALSLRKSQPTTDHSVSIYQEK